MNDSTCPIYQGYEREASEVTIELNRSRNLQDKAKLAQKLIDLETKLSSCEEADDPNCRMQRQTVVSLRRKTAETILKLWQARLP